MKKGVIIEMSQENLIECDTHWCDYTIPNESGEPNQDLTKYLNQECPKCGANLLTEDDLIDYNRVLKIVNRINKWFGWMTYLVFWKTKESTATVKVHEGITIEKQNQQKD